MERIRTYNLQKFKAPLKPNGNPGEMLSTTVEIQSASETSKPTDAAYKSTTVEIQSASET